MSMYSHALPAAALLFAAAVTSACGDSSALDDAPTLSGQLQGWTQGQQPLQARFAGADTPIVSSTIDASGKFSIHVTGVSVATAKFTTQNLGPNKPPTSGCTGTQSWDPISYGNAILSLYSPMSPRSYVIIQTNQVNEAGSIVSYFYVDRDWNETVTIDCQNSRGGVDHISVDLHYKLGWNRQIETTIITGNDRTVKTYTGPEPDGGVGWKAFAS